MKIEELIKSTFRSEQQKAIVNLSYTSGMLDGRLNGILKPFDLSIQQFNILKILKGQQGKPASVLLLTERMIDKMSNASRLVEKLRKKGLVTRTACANDRRRVDVVISQKGLDELKGIDDLIKNQEKKICRLSDSDAKRLNELLDKMRA